MSAATAHAPVAPAKPELLRYTNLGPLIFGLGVAAVGGLVVCIIAAVTNWHAFLFSWLFAFMFFFTISAGALFWNMLHFAVDAEWSVVVRRILETMANSFTWLWIAFIPLAVGAHSIYKWMDVPKGVDPILDGKRALLNPTFWAVRAVVWFSFFFTVSRLLRWWSTKQDLNGNPKYSTLSRGLVFGSLAIFAVAVTFGAIDWVMSIQYHWYSTMWGVYIFAGSAWSSMAVLILITYALKNAGYLEGIVSTEHFHIMGKLLLSFTVFWAYIAFDQFFLIWYANIPEETEFFLIRNTGSWNFMTIAFQVIGHFFVTFVLLCPRVMKTKPKLLAGVCVWVLLMHAADLYIIINPFLNEKGVKPLTAIIDLAALVTIGAPLALVFLRTLGKHSIYPMRDPRLPESLRLVN